jgi:hypothetical protein
MTPIRVSTFGFSDEPRGRLFSVSALARNAGIQVMMRMMSALKDFDNIIGSLVSALARHVLVILFASA